VALGKSHGYESADSKRFMRHSVIVADLLGEASSAQAPFRLSNNMWSPKVSQNYTVCPTVLVPAMLACRKVFSGGDSAKGDLMLLGALMNPALLLIDHGHFQYNSISLGLAVSFLIPWCSAHQSRVFSVLCWCRVSLLHLKLYQALPYRLELLQLLLVAGMCWEASYSVFP